MKFLLKQYNNGLEERQEVAYQTVEEARDYMNSLFNEKDYIARYEEMKMSDGRISISVKDRANKIIIQLKTTEPVV